MKKEPDVIVANAITKAPIKVQCTVNGLPWHGSFYDKQRVDDMVKRLKANKDIADIIITYNP